MNPTKEICAAVLHELAEVECRIDEPADVRAPWFVDFVAGERAVVVECRPGRGFGISAIDEAAYGQGPDEVYSSAVLAAQRVIELLREGGRTVPSDEVLLRELRELMKMTQKQLGDAMGVGQAHLSKVEHRSDASLSTLTRPPLAPPSSPAPGGSTSAISSVGPRLHPRPRLGFRSGQQR